MPTSTVNRQKLNVSMVMNNYIVNDLANILNSGTVPTPNIIGNYDNAPVKLEYKRKGERSDKYTSLFPNDIGEYDIRATIHQTDNYRETVIYSTFSIYTIDSNTIDGHSVISIKSNTTVGNVADIDTKIYGEYKDSDDTIREKMTIEKIDLDNNLNVLSQYSIGENESVHIDTSISGKIPFTIEKCVIIGNRVICYTSSKKTRYDTVTTLEDTPFSLCKIDTEEFFNALVSNAPVNSIPIIRMPRYEQKAVMNNGVVDSYHYERISGDVSINLECGYMYDDYESAYSPDSTDEEMFSGDSKVITSSGISISNSSYGKYIIEMPMKHIKDYFPDMRIYYETRINVTI